MSVNVETKTKELGKKKAVTVNKKHILKYR